MILVRKPNVPDRPSEAIGRRLFGNPDEVFLQSKPKQGLLTPAEVRAMALAEMDLGPASTVWDIGAGSGSVAIEAAQIAAAGTTYAIEMDADDHALITLQRRAVRRAQSGARAGPGARRLGRAARSRRGFRRRHAAARSAGIVEVGLRAAAAGGPVGGQRGRRSRTLAGVHESLQQHVENVQDLDDQHGPRHLSTGTHAVRGPESHVSVGGRKSRQSRAVRKP